MRINKYVSLATGLGRRQADTLIASGRLLIDNKPAILGQQVDEFASVKLDGKTLSLPVTLTTIIFNKPVGLVVSRIGQGAKTIYEVLPPEFRELKPVGRLDKDSSGLLMLTNDGDLAQSLAHPSKKKIKEYEVRVDKPLSRMDFQKINNVGVMLDDGISKIGLKDLSQVGDYFKVTMNEGRNRQIRRTFKALGYQVTYLHRVKFGIYSLEKLQSGEYKVV